MKRLLVAAALAIAALACTAAPAVADPYDAQLQGREFNPQFLLTPLFLPGEDLSDLGVSQAELATTGMQSSEHADHDHNLIVDDDHAQCPNADFTSIQAAVNASGPYTLIRVCPGLYQEQVDIGPGHDGLVLYSQQPRQAVIKAPALVMTEPGDIVRVHGSQYVGILQFTISGPLPDTLFCSLTTRTGVRIDQGGSALLFNNRITEIRSTDPLLRGCQNGVAVLVGRNFEGTTGTGWITHNQIDAYQKGAIVVDNTGSKATIDHNLIAHGPPDMIVIAPNGIQVSRGARADVDHNIVKENSGGQSGTGILLFQAGSGLVDVDHNDVFKNDDGISLYDSDNESVSHNNSHEQLFYDGFFMDADSTGNTIDHNDAYLNTEHDCHDDSTGGGTAGTANYWLHDKGNTQNRPGLCRTTHH
ncbi:MAG TPA: right-handed parallel beta-helix repeat-containing protein [Gaiellaceae bacterium]|jgi:parallel beta-helix repeat protein